MYQINLRSGKNLPPRVALSRQQADEMKQVVMEAGHAKVIKSIEGVTHNVLAHLKMIPSLLSIYDALWLSKDLRQSLVYTL